MTHLVHIPQSNYYIINLPKTTQFLNKQTIESIKLLTEMMIMDGIVPSAFYSLSLLLNQNNNKFHCEYP